MVDDVKKPRKKLTLEQKVAAAQDQIKKAEDVIKSAKELTSKYESRKKIIIGALLMKAAESDPKFAKAMKILVDRAKPDDQLLYASFGYAQEKNPPSPLLSQKSPSFESPMIKSPSSSSEPSEGGARIDDKGVDAGELATQSQPTEA